MSYTLKADDDDDDDDDDKIKDAREAVMTYLRYYPCILLWRMR
jgi:hypothetical protein